MKINVKQLIRQTIALFTMTALLLFVPAGTFSWPTGWLFLILIFSGLIYINIWLFNHNPELLQERMSLTRPDQKGWDKLLFPLVLAYPMLSLGLIALDAGRFHWSPVPLWVQGAGLAMLACAFVIFLQTYRENTFLSTVVRVQKERGHTVVSTGPYHYIRHPMYAAFILLVFGAPLLLGAWYGILLGIIFLALVNRRATMEERVLEQELDGYADYMKQVKYRFLPFIW